VSEKPDQNTEAKVAMIMGFFSLKGEDKEKLVRKFISEQRSTADDQVLINLFIDKVLPKLVTLK